LAQATKRLPPSPPMPLAAMIRTIDIILAALVLVAFS
jgi:hypothetical protein